MAPKSWTSANTVDCRSSAVTTTSATHATRRSTGPGYPALPTRTTGTTYLARDERTTSTTSSVEKSTAGRTVTNFSSAAGFSTTRETTPIGMPGG